MKPVFSRFSVLFISALLCMIMCKSPVNNKVQKAVADSWIEELTIHNSARIQKGQIYYKRYS